MLCGLGLCLSASALAEDGVESSDSVPDADFIEYVGMWEESDEDWQLLDVEAAAERYGGTAP